MSWRTKDSWPARAWVELKPITRDEMMRADLEQDGTKRRHG
ncbi:hypothetical protein [Ochrobactrum sp. S1502_03]|uniref:Uncharacterized protein n=1 Tax=Ochrobactrum chromiisoli TaxID=2993941 RepID=A0ABT3QQM2_9HYPH|nr:hypothetical protein [Ochrobactrum chromiisoli]